MKLRALAFALAFLIAPAVSSAQDSRIDALAADYVVLTLRADPTYGTLMDVSGAAHDSLADRTPPALAKLQADRLALISTLNKLPRDDLSDLDQRLVIRMTERLEAQTGAAAACRQELWNITHMNSWAAGLVQVAVRQPVKTPAARADALKRFGELPRYVDVEIRNLKRGLAAGYSVPKPVVRREIVQVEALIKPGEGSAYYGMARRDGDAAFGTEVARLINGTINPALARYVAFLRTEYLPQARDTLGISALPNGRACYDAMLRVNTSLDRTGPEVFELGSRTVAARTAEVIELGRESFGLSDFGAIVERAKSDPARAYQSGEDLFAYAQSVMESARQKTAAIANLPTQPVVVERMLDFEEAAGRSSYYLGAPDTSQPGIFRAQLGQWRNQRRGQTEILVAHEAWPGHHLQIATSRAAQTRPSVERLLFNSAYAEGWGRYAEALAEEVGLYTGVDAKILRRAWPARGMVVDPGIHLMGWTREQAVDFMAASGQWGREGADELVDRIASWPGQLTAYDSGALEIVAARAEAEEALGTRFDLKRFHASVVGLGNVPLTELRAHVKRWIASERLGERPQVRRP